MNLDELIIEGEHLKEYAEPDSMMGAIIPLDELEKWMTKVIFYANANLEDQFLFQKIQENAKGLTTNGYKKFLSTLGILKGIKESL
ncbi:hypothetical protein NSQ82_07720 [Caldifermentibacillus hisashii]|uniref:hypothetical protein n=1 Tax=Caldifermentibacillus hisashii TaxID=996558 RepID=UPI0031B6B917